MGGVAVLKKMRGRTAAGLGVAVATLLLGACVGAEHGEGNGPGSHAELTCVACHQGALADAGMAAVPGNTCTSSGCHGQSIPSEISVSTVTFEHRGHGAEADVAVGCAGCHTHRTGEAPLTAGVDACGLCHAEDLGGEQGQACAECHSRPEHVTATSQGVPIPHEGLPWISRSCVRCHYDVAEPPHEVPIARCRACHTDLQDTSARAVGRDLHPDHTGVACISCHEGGSHRIVAMSSAVDLECTDCHLRVHEVEVPADWPAENCIACHRDSHQDQQRLLLGLAGEGREPVPSEKFMSGMVCRSCHVRDPGAPSPETPTGKAEACVGCHEPRYATILRWWDQGLRQRATVVKRYVSRGRADLGAAAGSDSVGILLDDAETRLTLVEDAGGQHNLRLAHRLFVESLARTARAYEAAGRTPPDRPYLGRSPSMGICSYCHYRLDDPMEFREMPEDFHLRVMNR